MIRLRVTARTLGGRRAFAAAAAASADSPAIAWPRPGRVGMVGVGQLGSAVTGNLLRAGLQPVLYDLRGEASVRHFLDQGAQWAASPRELAERCEVVMTGLPRPEHVSAAMGLGEQAESEVAPNGILAGL